MQSFLESYIEAALWSSTDAADLPLDATYSAEDLAPATRAAMARDCAAFEAANAEDIAGSPMQAGHDFWLTRNGHGAGFWDDDEWTEDEGERLTKAAEAFGPCNLYVGDDGKLYC